MSRRRRAAPPGCKGFRHLDRRSPNAQFGWCSMALPNIRLSSLARPTLAAICGMRRVPRERTNPRRLLGLLSDGWHGGSPQGPHDPKPCTALRRRDGRPPTCALEGPSSRNAGPSIGPGGVHVPPRRPTSPSRARPCGAALMDTVRDTVILTTSSIGEGFRAIVAASRSGDPSRSIGSDESGRGSQPPPSPTDRTGAVRTVSAAAAHVSRGRVLSISPPSTA